MTRTEKCVIARGKNETTLWYYCSEVEDNKLYYVVTVDYKKVYKEEEELNDVELERIVNYYACI